MLSEIQSTLLRIVCSQLFQKPLPNVVQIEWEALLKEAEQQTVFSIVYTAVEELLPEIVLSKARTQYFLHMRSSIRNAHQHGELHELLSEHKIPDVIIKGMASAAYYPDPFLRAMGDVDFLVPKEKLEETKKLLLERGYTTNENSNHHAHLAFHKGPEVLEMHLESNGIPEGQKGDICRNYLSNVIETANTYETQNERFLVPDAFHHGLVMLLHTATHMINTGIGLRHLCDWAVFVGKLEEKEFRSLFEEKLKTAGLWRFAQLLTQLSIEYLGCPIREWAMEFVDHELLQSMIEDVFAGGNFGKKDAERINEAKLFTTRDSGTVNNSRTVMLRALSEKAYRMMPMCRKIKLLLPIGWLVVGVKHMSLILRGKRPKIHISKMLRGAETRRGIYKEFQLFQ